MGLYFHSFGEHANKNWHATSFCAATGTGKQNGCDSFLGATLYFSLHSFFPP